MQQVNLYTEEFRPQRALLSLGQLLACLGMTLLVLMLLSLWLNASLSSAAAESRLQSDRSEDMQRRVDELAARVALLKQDESLVTANKRLKAQVNARENMLRTLDSVAIRDDAGFSPFLIGLARQKVDGLALSKISLAAAGRSMILEGETNSAEAVPTYLEKLRNEPIFLGRSFTLFDIETDAENLRSIHFRLQSEAEGGTPYLIRDEEQSKLPTLEGEGNAQS